MASNLISKPSVSRMCRGNLLRWSRFGSAGYQDTSALICRAGFDTSTGLIWGWAIIWALDGWPTKRAQNAWALVRHPHFLIFRLLQNHPFIFPRRIATIQVPRAQPRTPVHQAQNTRLVHQGYTCLMPTAPMTCEGDT